MWEFLAYVGTLGSFWGVARNISLDFLAEKLNVPRQAQIVGTLHELKRCLAPLVARLLGSGIRSGQKL